MLSDKPTMKDINSCVPAAIMPEPESPKEVKQPTPAQVYYTAVLLARLKRMLVTLPHVTFKTPPTAELGARIDITKSPAPIINVLKLAQETYHRYAVRLLPAGATDMCRDLGHAFAQDDPDYEWGWSWDAENGRIVDASDNDTEIEFPAHSPSYLRFVVTEMRRRSTTIRWVIQQKEGTPSAAWFLGEDDFDFGAELRHLSEEIVTTMDEAFDF